MKVRTFLLVASYPASILSFRGALISELQRAGFRIHVAAPEISKDLKLYGRLKELGIEAHDILLNRTGTSLFQDLRSLASLHKVMKGIQPSFVLSYTIKPAIYGTFAAALAKVPNRFILITGLGYAFSTGGSGFLGYLRASLQLVVRRLYASALKRAQAVYFQNEDDRDLFLSLGILQPSTKSLVVNGSGVDLNHFFYAPVPNLSSPRFLLIARLLGAKGVREYAEAARRILAVFPQAKFMLAGWIDDNPDAIQPAELDNWVASGTVEFLGKLEDVRPAIARASVYVLPSYREGTPRTVLEAMSMGRAIVSTDAPGCRQTVVDGENGFLVPVKSVGALEQAMLKFCADPALAPTMGRRSREIAEAKFDVDAVNADMLRGMGIVRRTPVAVSSSCVEVETSSS